MPQEKNPAAFAISARKQKRHLIKEPLENNTQLTDEFLDTLREKCSFFFDHVHDDESVFLTYLVYGNRDTIAGNEDFINRKRAAGLRIFGGKDLDSDV